jgi:hypothetical protein
MQKRSLWESVTAPFRARWKGGDPLTPKDVPIVMDEIPRTMDPATGEMVPIADLSLDSEPRWQPELLQPKRPKGIVFDVKSKSLAGIINAKIATTTADMERSRAEAEKAYGLPSVMEALEATRLKEEQAQTVLDGYAEKLRRLPPPQQTTVNPSLGESLAGLVALAAGVRGDYAAGATVNNAARRQGIEDQNAKAAYEALQAGDRMGFDMANQRLNRVQSRSDWLEQARMGIQQSAAARAYDQSDRIQGRLWQLEDRDKGREWQLMDREWESNNFIWKTERSAEIALAAEQKSKLWEEKELWPLRERNQAHAQLISTSMQALLTNSDPDGVAPLLSALDQMGVETRPEMASFFQVLAKANRDDKVHKQKMEQIALGMKLRMDNHNIQTDRRTQDRLDKEATLKEKQISGELLGPGEVPPVSPQPGDPGMPTSKFSYEGVAFDLPPGDLPALRKGNESVSKMLTSAQEHTEISRQLREAKARLAKASKPLEKASIEGDITALEEKQAKAAGEHRTAFAQARGSGPREYWNWVETQRRSFVDAMASLKKPEVADAIKAAALGRAASSLGLGDPLSIADFQQALRDEFKRRTGASLTDIPSQRIK